jgi:hypothetical protein
MRYGISRWHAGRWIAAAHALGDLPIVHRAFSDGMLGLEKVVELCRFATPETEAELVVWAGRASTWRIRRKADLARRGPPDEAADVDRSRRVNWWWFDQGKRFGLEADLPAADGAVVAKALDRLASELPVMPDEDDLFFADARRADALVALASARVAQDPDPDRATVVVHAQLGVLGWNGTRPPKGAGFSVGTNPPDGARRANSFLSDSDGSAALSGSGGAEIENGPVIAPETARRLACNARIQLVVENPSGGVVGLGRTSREPSEWMMRQLRYRDGGCTFPGCDAKAFTQAHHIEWWSRGGRTDLENLALVCSFHHKLPHEYGWRIRRRRDGGIRWFRPDGTEHRAGPGAAPPSSLERPVLAGAPP